ncbi:MAG: hypothetical protein CMM26_11295 [Rhodospirillaceae bacterium]|nr:hypothetical protein [Rhodospirillaceae bacterium]
MSPATLLLFDVAIRTLYYADRCPPADIGIDRPMQASFMGQVSQPFRRNQATVSVLRETSDRR